MIEKPSIPRIASRLIDSPSGCWEWSGARDSNGYGRVSWEGENCLVHRVVYVLVVGEIPVGLELDHLCRNTSCANPEHLEPVTHFVNGQRSTAGDPRPHMRRTHCPQGHEYTEENTYRHGGKKKCRTCSIFWSRRWKERQKGAA